MCLVVTFFSKTFLILQTNKGHILAFSDFYMTLNQNVLNFYFLFNLMEQFFKNLTNKALLSNINFPRNPIPKIITRKKIIARITHSWTPCFVKRTYLYNYDYKYTFEKYAFGLKIKRIFSRLISDYAFKLHSPRKFYQPFKVYLTVTNI